MAATLRVDELRAIVEAQRPGEGEMACALRLLARVLERYPQAFDVVSGDNLYMNPELCKLVRSRHKHLIAVLKNENRGLLEDARSLLANATPVSVDDKHVRRTRRDLQGFTTWPQCEEPVRAVQSIEEAAICRQLTRENETVQSQWLWVTSLPETLADTAAIVHAGHGRWGIENYGFNELGNQWHGDHAYKYDTHALLACTLFLFIAYNLFHTFIERNLKPEAKHGRTEKHWAHLIAGEYAAAFHSYSAPPQQMRSPTNFCRHPTEPVPKPPSCLAHPCKPPDPFLQPRRRSQNHTKTTCESPHAFP